jgi:hypothetical protein
VWKNCFRIQPESDFRFEKIIEGEKAHSFAKAHPATTSWEKEGGDLKPVSKKRETPCPGLLTARE